MEASKAIAAPHLNDSLSVVENHEGLKAIFTHLPQELFFHLFVWAMVAGFSYENPMLSEKDVFVDPFNGLLSVTVRATGTKHNCVLTEDSHR